MPTYLGQIITIAENNYFYFSNEDFRLAFKRCLNLKKGEEDFIKNKEKRTDTINNKELSEFLIGSDNCAQVIYNLSST